MNRSSTAPRRLAIIGGGSSGLITLKTALELLPEWESVCFERSDRITGCWGNPYPGFVSTSTKYTTQFSCFAPYSAEIHSDGGNSRAEFFRDDEYGKYLEQFAAAFGLQPYVRLRQSVQQISRDASGSGWQVTSRQAAFDQSNDASADEATCEYFDAVVICTGLAAVAKPIDAPVSQISLSELNRPGGIAGIKNQSIVVFGGGESAVDYANRLSQPELNNRVYLSLRTGVRVSPRYHPIRGVPSDFLRNRLMLSIHPQLRNWIGQRFVEARILHQERFQKWFPATAPAAQLGAISHAQSPGDSCDRTAMLKKEWAFRLTRAAKDDLFNMFHNKSDDFLDAVAAGRIEIIGPPLDDDLQTYRQFDGDEVIQIRPDCILPAIGYRSTLSDITGGSIGLRDFYLGCCHQSYADLFLVGFARPIIGNIPTISEVQAMYVCSMLGGRVQRPEHIMQLNQADQQANGRRYAKLNLDAIYPVEMFPYCDRLARAMKMYPRASAIGSLRSWWRMQLTPSTTLHYWFVDPTARDVYERAPIYMPPLLILLLLLLKPIDAAYRLVYLLRGTLRANSPEI